MLVGGAVVEVPSGLGAVGVDLFSDLLGIAGTGDGVGVSWLLGGVDALSALLGILDPAAVAILDLGTVVCCTLEQRELQRTALDSVLGAGGILLDFVVAPLNFC